MMTEPSVQNEKAAYCRLPTADCLLMMTTEASLRAGKQWLDTLASLSAQAERERFLSENADLRQPSVVAWLCEQIPALSQLGLQQAENVARAAAWLAEHL